MSRKRVRSEGDSLLLRHVMQGVHALHVHLKAVADAARAGIRARSALADPYIARAGAQAHTGN